MNNSAPHGILSIATALPPHCVTTSEMLEIISAHVSPELVDSVESLGVQSRHICVENLKEYMVGKTPRKLSSTTADLGVMAAEQCLQDCDPADIGLIIAMTNTANRHIPCFAYEIQSKLLKYNIPSDINILSLENEGCSALLKGIETAQNYMLAHPDKLVLLVAAEGHSGFFVPLTEKFYWSFKELKEKGNDQKELLNTIKLINDFLFGDGAVAILMGANGKKGRFDTIKHLTNIQEQDIDVIYMNEGGMIRPKYEGYPQYILTPYVPSRGEVYAEKITQMILDTPTSSIKQVEEADHLLVHTGSKKILDAVKSKIQHPDEKSVISYEILNDFGNLSNCSVGFMLEKCIKNKVEGKALIISFGAGFSASACTFQFESS